MIYIVLSFPATGNATQQANQGGGKMQAGIANVTQESKSAANKTGVRSTNMIIW